MPISEKNPFYWFCDLCQGQIWTEEDGVFDAKNNYSAHKDCLFEMLLEQARKLAEMKARE